jgi:hydrogenase expression/formation protein HypE
MIFAGSNGPGSSQHSPGQQKIMLAHGGGGRLMHQLIDDLFITILVDPEYDAKHDAAICTAGGAKLAFTTDSFVVDPLFFPGGDIGSLAVWGTVNDLAMCGARPLYLSVGFIIEEGFAIEQLQRIVRSMRAAADRAGARIVTGDTKVVEFGKGHGVFINTAGIGRIDHGLEINPARIAPGDVIIVNGDIGRHGIAVMASREGLSFEPPITSDLAPLAAPVMALIEAGVNIHCLRDLTRGGLATALVELAQASGRELCINEREIPVSNGVRAACEILGFDPLYVANEGRFTAFLPPDDLDTALATLRAVDAEPHVIGAVSDAGSPLVTVKTLMGTERVVDMLSGEQLPRIC